MTTGTRLGAEDLAAVFTVDPGRRELIGVEVECGLVDPASGNCVGYAGRHGARALLELLLADDETGGEPIVEAGFLVGVAYPDGSSFSLELGNALEFSGSPQSTVHRAVQLARAALVRAARLADRLGLAVLPGALLPFTDVSGIQWAPKPRIQVMRDYFASLGAAGGWAEGVMGLTLSTQTTLDYTSTTDLFDKLRTQAAASPIAAALFVNSPLESGRPAGVLSRRMQLWERVAPDRTGVLPFTLRADATIAELVEWALELPMIYRRHGSRYTAAADRPFREVLRSGFGDGSYPTRADWLLHLSQNWPHIRVRETLELRAADGPPWPELGAAPAFWAGLIYDPQSRAAAWELLRGLSYTQLQATTHDVAVRGLAAMAGRAPVRELCGQLLVLARRGLAARIAAGLEEPGTLTLLDSLEEVRSSGRTFAEHTLDRWHTDLARDPARYVAACRVPV